MLKKYINRVMPDDKQERDRLTLLLMPEEILEIKRQALECGCSISRYLKQASDFFTENKPKDFKCEGKGKK